MGLKEIIRVGIIGMKSPTEATSGARGSIGSFEMDLHEV